MNQLMSQADYARYRGVGRPAVSNWKRAGHLVLAEDQAGRLMIDVMRTDARLNARIDPMRGRPASAATTVPITVAPRPATDDRADQATVSSERLELIREQRTGQALRNAQTARELVPLSEAMAILLGAARTLRERTQSELRGLAERLANEAETRAIMMLLEETIDRVFNDVAAEIEAADDEDDTEEAIAE